MIQTGGNIYVLHDSSQLLPVQRNASSGSLGREVSRHRDEVERAYVNSDILPTRPRSDIANNGRGPTCELRHP